MSGLLLLDYLTGETLLGLNLSANMKYKILFIVYSSVHYERVNIFLILVSPIKKKGKII